MKFNDRLHQLREDRFLKKTELAKILNTSRQQISKYESGVSVPTVDVFLKIADYFEVSADYLLGRDDYITLPRDSEQKYIVLPDELTEENIGFIRTMVDALRREHGKDREG